ncbi:hypothetical protein OEA41_006290, partial [Lepraria neglecta]
PNLVDTRTSSETTPLRRLDIYVAVQQSIRDKKIAKDLLQEANAAVTKAEKREQSAREAETKAGCRQTNSADAQPAVRYVTDSELLPDSLVDSDEQRPAFPWEAEARAKVGGSRRAEEAKAEAGKAAKVEEVDAKVKAEEATQAEEVKAEVEMAVEVEKAEKAEVRVKVEDVAELRC